MALLVDGSRLFPAYGPEGAGGMGGGASLVQNHNQKPMPYSCQLLSIVN